MLVHIHKTIFLYLTVFWTSLALAQQSGHTANPLTLKLEGRGLYQEAMITLYDGTSVTLEAPVTGWLDDMPQKHLDALRGINLKDLPALAHLLDQGIKHSAVPLEISLVYPAKGKRQTRIVLPVKQISSQYGNMTYTLQHPVDMPEDIENAALLFKTWPAPAEEDQLVELGGRRPTKAVCCDCSGGCAALWILFGWCKQCLSAMGGEYCCSEYRMPAATGGKCP
ncbi:hypothetical protein GZ77_10295 [Endozoicomonas montiporae]|uniref:Uncharacterized protein n=2 Tax=Endozoicomonas montiporae TaxID=1027273 RepID=A0A081N8C1_9GAMM|nr:hypothetical protein [Endozoicomonas montiporae]AMO55417.1 hypothetical protein EZMO1_1224 [Endozoicomonas montiporae CL-33]KEQ14694.1 hypothetical protein GZ77_10295 [Endozoicomonas montiporae]